jgi:cyclopropane fatty-acyl-phospholipid synthase-like methyltransferase
MNVVNPLAVDSSMSLLDLTAGLGGPSRHVAKTFDVYVTALDRSIELAERGQAMSVAAGLGKRVPVRSFDVETVEFKPRSFDAAWAQFLTCGVADKERLFREVHRGLRPRGQISIVEFMLRDADPADPRIVALRHPVQGRLQLWRMSQYLDCLGNAGFVCRAMEDHSAVLRGHVMRGWRDVLKAEDWRSRSRRLLVALFEEAEMWFRLLAAIDAGLVGVTRLHAIVK